MKAAFTIQSMAELSAKPFLLIQVGRQGISFLQLDSETQTFTSVQIYHFAKGISISSMAKELNGILEKENLQRQFFKKVHIIWSFDESLLIPNDFYEKDQAQQMMELVFGHVSKSAVQNEMVMSRNLRNVYEVPETIKSIFNSNFPFSIQSHQNSIIIDFEKDNNNFLYCTFYPNCLTLCLRKNGKLQLIQNFNFNTPEDAVYHLLNTCEQFNINAMETTLQVSGMIDVKSNLYTELFKYFLIINFSILPVQYSYTAEVNDYPEHYFSHLFRVASCVL